LKRRKVHFEEAGDDLAEMADMDYEHDFDHEDIARIKQAIQALPAGYKTVFNLYLLEGYDHSEISEILGISEGASKSQYSRARQKLHQMLTPKSKTG
jgi:RNA polymerase sigma-70 factor (ECF subfamily)